MSSNIQTTLELLVLNNYVSLIIVTAASYDYILTFSREIEYIWVRSCPISTKRLQYFYSPDHGPGFPRCLLWSVTSVFAGL
ncbi:hypothetical protein L210DRAFT_2063237 [Boletus edulis BED1]|uniref:DUF6533 domain-containing protein n=1 Tax=Boletus edulis BED1 TaxID=1328754 RepID=A0AAD4CAZ4_BOLED|nr:hypothetical protein L210DRAFT_2063237 [Boletus edulis BED1]